MKKYYIALIALLFQNCTTVQRQVKLSTLIEVSIESLQPKVAKVQLQVKVTMYHANEKMYNETSYVATGEKVKDAYDVPKWIAVSRDLLDDFPLMSRVYIDVPGLEGVYSVRDKMGRKKRNQIDILTNKDRPLDKMWTSIKITKI